MAKKVLVVDDEKLIVKGIRFSLEQDGMEVDCAYDGEEALSMAKEKEYDMILLDLMLPKMDGLEMVRRLREAGSRAYVIILTAYDSFAYAQTAIRLGAVDFLLKPFHDGDLENAVLALQKRIAAQTAPQPEPLPGVKPGPKSRYVREAMVYL